LLYNLKQHATENIIAWWENLVHVTLNNIFNHCSLTIGLESSPKSARYLNKAILGFICIVVYQLDKQVFDLFVAKNKFLDDLDKNDVRKYLDEAYQVFKATHQDVLDNINKNKKISDEDAEILLNENKEFFENLNK
jgi:hypothetical protein